MTNKELQRRRMMGYFIDAAIQIIDEEGVEAVSARRVAELAGFSYATIYNYFKDLNDLLWHCVPNRLTDLVEPKKLSGPTGADKLRQACRAYAQFFLDHPHSFRFMFLTDMGQESSVVKEEFPEPPFAKSLITILSQCAAEGSIDFQDIPALTSLMGFVVNGALMFYITKRMEVSQEEFFRQLDISLTPILKIKLIMKKSFDYCRFRIVGNLDFRRLHAIPSYKGWERNAGKI